MSDSSAARSLTGRARGALVWWFAPLPLGRVAAFRVAAYAFVFIDVLGLRPWVSAHGSVAGELYRPLLVGRLLHLPTPTPLLTSVVEIALLLSAGAALTGRWPRAAGWAVFALYSEWMVIAFSYGKVDHDRWAFLVALAVLPTVGRARLGQRTPSDAAGWALRCIQLAVVATYFLSLWAKLRFGGFGWPSSAVLERAILQRGTFLATPLLDHPGILVAAQYGTVIFELCSPLLLVRGRVGRAYLVAAAGFHVVTYAAISIMFWPHVLCLLCAFLPLERVRLDGAMRRLLARPGAPLRGG